MAVTVAHIEGVRFTGTVLTVGTGWDYANLLDALWSDHTDEDPNNWVSRITTDTLVAVFAENPLVEVPGIYYKDQGYNVYFKAVGDVHIYLGEGLSIYLGLVNAGKVICEGFTGFITYCTSDIEVLPTIFKINKCETSVLTVDMHGLSGDSLFSFSNCLEGLGGHIDDFSHISIHKCYSGISIPDVGWAELDYVMTPTEGYGMNYGEDLIDISIRGENFDIIEDKTDLNNESVFVIENYKDEDCSVMLDRDGNNLVVS